MSDKRAAAGGAGFVELHAVYGLVFDFYAFHVLPADVQDTIHLRMALFYTPSTAATTAAR